MTGDPGTLVAFLLISYASNGSCQVGVVGEVGENLLGMESETATAAGELPLSSSKKREKPVKPEEVPRQVPVLCKWDFTYFTYYTYFGTGNAAT
jgi:hypothetical protein